MTDGSHHQHQLILFDIDGTLINTGGAGERAMSRAFADVCHVENGFEGVPFPGRTDPAILADVLGRHGLDPAGEIVDRFRAVYYQRLVEELARPLAAARILPGVVDLLGALVRRPRTTVSLLTGNYSQSARLKLEHFGLWRYFQGGAFGEDAANRPGLVPVAVVRAAALGAPPARPRDVVVVGDTPLDVATGLLNGGRSIAVATGSFDAATLADAGADLVLEDLTAIDAFLDALDDGEPTRRPSVLAG
jgi:phosphoglycolate phosphatase-like HAD superfamily hydrolase